MDLNLSDDFKLKIELIDIEEISPEIAYLKKFKINNEYELKYIQVISWPNKGLPGEIEKVNILMEKLFNYFKEQVKEEPPTLIHCYDGVGRTGTLITIFLIMMCLEELKKMKKAPIMGIFNTLYINNITIYFHQSNNSTCINQKIFFINYYIKTI